MESAYASTFLTSVEPQQAAVILRDRVAGNRAVAEDLAEWFKELHSIEQVYSRSLAKLASRVPLAEPADLGVLEKAWRRNIDNINSLAANHSRFANKVEQELVGPLSQYDRTPENGNMGMLERNLAQIGKEMENADSKAQKASQSKSKNRSTKQSEAQEELRRARSKWESESPNAFEKLQQVDESRISFIRDALIRYETSAIDLYTAQTKLSETSVAALLDINPTDEPMDFVTKKLAQTPGQPTPLRPSSMGRTASHGETSSIRSSGGAASSLKSKFGTLLKGRRSGSPTKRQSMLPSSSINSNMNRQALPEMREEPEPRLQAVPATAHSASSYERSGEVQSSVLSPAPVVNNTNTSDRRNPFTTQQIAPTAALLSPDIDVAERQSSTTTNVPSTLRNVNIRSDSFTETSHEDDEAAADLVATTLRAQPTISRRARGRRGDARNTIYGSAGDEPVQAIARDVLGSPLARDEPIFSNNDVQASEAVAIAAPPASLSASSGHTTQQAQFINRQNTASAFSFDGAESIRSSRSTNSALQSSKHAEPTTDGIHLSVVESVSLLLSSAGTPSNFSVHGEAAAACRAVDNSYPLRLQIQAPESIERLVANNHILRPQGENTFELDPTVVQHMTTLFKYQATSDPSRQARFIPILVNQKWTPEDNQTSVKLTYRLNPQFGAGSLTLQDVEVIVGLDGSATSCVAKPSGTFIKKSSKLVWRLNELTLEAGKEGTLLARFKTEARCDPSSNIEIKFKTAASNIARGTGFGVHVTRSKDNPFADSPTVENVLVQNAYVLSSGSFAVVTSTD